MIIANNVNKCDDSDFKTYLKHSISSTIVLDPPQFNVVKGLLSFRALKSGIRFPLNLKSFRLEKLNPNSKINLGL